MLLGETRAMKATRKQKEMEALADITLSCYSGPERQDKRVLSIKCRPSAQKAEQGREQVTPMLPAGLYDYDTDHGPGEGQLSLVWPCSPQQNWWERDTPPILPQQLQALAHRYLRAPRLLTPEEGQVPYTRRGGWGGETTITSPHPKQGYYYL